jgi:hypothetical protein
VKGILSKVLLIAVAAIAVSGGVPANTAGNLPANTAGNLGPQPVILCVDDLKPGDAVFFRVVNVNGKVLVDRLTNIFDLDGKPTGGGAPPDGGSPDVPPGNTALSEVRASFSKIGKLDVFDQQVAVFRYSLRVAASLETRDQAYNSVFNLLEVTLGDFASPQWSPWVDPFIEAMENEPDLAAFVAVVDAARASLSEDD